MNGREEFEKLTQEEKRHVVNILNQLHQMYSIYVQTNQNIVDLPYFFYSVFKDNIFGGENYPTEMDSIYVREFIEKAIYCISSFLIKQRK